MIQLWTAVAVAVLTVIVGPILRGELSGRLLKRVTAHAELREHLADNVAAKEELDGLIMAEVKALRAREESRLTRKLNGGNVAALIFIAVLGGGLVYGLMAWAGAVAGTWFAVILYIVAALVGLFTIALAAVGVGTLYAPPRTEEERAATKAKNKRSSATP